MIEEEKYCVDILTQVASVQSALEQVSLLLMQSHLRYCVTEAVQEGKGEEKVREMVDVLRHYTHLQRAARREANGEPIHEYTFPAADGASGRLWRYNRQPEPGKRDAFRIQDPIISNKLYPGHNIPFRCHEQRTHESRIYGDAANAQRYVDGPDA